MNEDQSILSGEHQKDVSYLNDLAVAVCINGDSLEKYKKIVVKRYDDESYDNMLQFVEELQRQVELHRFTNTSLVSLTYLGKNAGLTEETVKKITSHFEDIFKEEESKKEEEEFWNQCRQDDMKSLLEYLTKYPNGIYAVQAKSCIADLEKKEIEAEEEERYFANCSSKVDYMEYLRKYPNGMYRNSAQAMLEIREWPLRPKPDKSNWILNIVSFLFPIIGWLLFFVFRYALKKPVMAKACAKSSIIGILFFLIIFVLI